MNEGYDRFDRFEDDRANGSFVMGLLTGTVLGAGLGVLFAPKPGADLRNQLSESANTISRTATEQYHRASEVIDEAADKGRQLYGKAREAVSRGTEEAQRYIGRAQQAVRSSEPHSPFGSSTSYTGEMSSDSPLGRS